MPFATYQLRWKPESISNLMRLHGIRTRTELATAIGVSRATAYATFNEDWCGTVTSVKVLTQMAGHFGVPLGQLVVEPAITRPTRQRAS